MTKKTFSLETSLRKIEEILASLESGEKDLEQSIQLFEEGIKLSEECQTHLQALEKRVKLLSKDVNGKPVEKDMKE
ncbi:MAG: exodeoxyribonuclease VII small subunit [Candidatus Marinimicrobia bacterium]|jgi:exodeoxyribonuclease VII small subunit|nr:exodeoxyribonuclease VII small subunit [Candidatus Neomarinimicrobiota bacterium]